MTRKIYSVKVNAPIEGVWRFISNMNNWAPLIPGYLEHEIVSEKESTWKFKSDFGLMKKKLQVKVEITNWNEPSQITFHFEDLKEKFVGKGYFEATKINNDKTLMTGCLDIDGQGKMGKIVNNMLKSNIPDMAKELTEAVALKIKEFEENHQDR